MFFQEISQIPQTAARTSCSVFVVPKEAEIPFKKALILRPDESKKTNLITVEQIRGFCEHATLRQTTERFFVIAPAEAMNEAAQNAFLKTFEEPKAHCHFVLLTENPLLLLPTILSRAQVFYLCRTGELAQPPQASPEVLTLAKQLVAAKSADLPKLAEKISKSKPSPRVLATEVAAAAVEILYKSYFKTQNPKFLSKIPNFIKLYEALEQNGHIKLHIVADLV